MNEPRLIPCGALHRDLRLDWDSPLLTNSPEIDLKFFESDHLHRHYVPYLSDYLRTPNRSKIHAVDAKAFANAATYCLQYLCNLGSSKQNIIPAVDSQLRLMRKICPWKSRQRRSTDKARGWAETPLMWVVYFWDMNKEPIPVLRLKRYRIMYARQPSPSSIRLDCDTEIVQTMLRSERYWLALHYLPIFLARAGYSDDLVDICRTKVFASKSQHFPRKSRHARSAMRGYLDKMGSALY